MTLPSDGMLSVCSTKLYDLWGKAVADRGRTSPREFATRAKTIILAYLRRPLPVDLSAQVDTVFVYRPRNRAGLGSLIDAVAHTPRQLCVWECRKGSW